MSKAAMGCMALAVVPLTGCFCLLGFLIGREVYKVPLDEHRETQLMLREQQMLLEDMQFQALERGYMEYHEGTGFRWVNKESPE